MSVDTRFKLEQNGNVSGRADQGADMPSPYPFQPNAVWDETPDWAVSDYPTFEKAVNSGAAR